MQFDPTGSPLLVTAGHGSRKTGVIIERIKLLTKLEGLATVKHKDKHFKSQKNRLKLF
jgi:hypothetical protein